MIAGQLWACCSGSLAPDTPYYDLPDPTYLWLPRSAVSLARQLHRASGSAIYSVAMLLLARLRGRGPEAAANLAFVLGFLSHLAVDMTFHPLIAQFVAERPPDSGGERAEHYRLESVLDCLLYEQCGKSLPETSLWRATRAGSGQSARLIRFYAGGLTAFCDWSESELYYALRRAFCKQLWLNCLFQKRGFFTCSGYLNRFFHGRLEVYHALAHPPLLGQKEEAGLGPLWRWAVQCWRAVPLNQVAAESLRRAEFLARTALRYQRKEISRKAAMESFTQVTASSGL